MSWCTYYDNANEGSTLNSSRHTYDGWKHDVSIYRYIVNSSILRRIRWAVFVAYETCSTLYAAAAISNTCVSKKSEVTSTT